MDGQLDNSPRILRGRAEESVRESQVGNRKKTRDSWRKRTSAQNGAGHYLVGSTLDVTHNNTMNLGGNQSHALGQADLVTMLRIVRYLTYSMKTS